MKHKKKDPYSLKEEYFCHIVGVICIILFIFPFLGNKTSHDCHNTWSFLNTTYYVWILKISLILWAVLSFYLAFVILKQYFITNDNPISKIHSAPQGYVELEGIQNYLPNKSLTSPLSNTSCTWYAYIVEEKRGRYWHEIESGESTENFLMTDTTGQCIIYPDGADIFPHTYKEWYDTPPGHWYKHRYVEQLLTPNEYIYVSGIFRTLDNPQIKEKQEEVFQLIKEWKQDYGKLLQNFDIKPNKDGEIEPNDWEKIVKSAEQQINSKYPNSLENPKTVNTISNHGIMLDQPFIISGLRKKDLLKKLYFKFIFYIVLFFTLIVPIFTIQTWYLDWFKHYCNI